MDDLVDTVEATDVKQHLPITATDENDEESELTARRESTSAVDESVPRRHMLQVCDMDSDGESASTHAPTITDQNAAKKPKQFVDFVTAISCEEVGVEQQREQVIECVECKRRFTSDKALADHFRTHTGERPFECIWCAQSFAMLRAMEQHAWKEHVKVDKQQSQHVRTFKCAFCPKVVGTASALTQHERTHRSHQHTCAVCDRQFSVADALVRHTLQWHTGVTDKSQMKKCERLAAPRFKCIECEKGYRNQKDYARHIAWHAKPYKCTPCEKAFMSKSGLDNHLMSDTHITHCGPPDPSLITSPTCPKCQTRAFESPGLVARHALTCTGGKITGATRVDNAEEIVCGVTQD